MHKRRVTDEIKRIAAKNDGRAPGREKFESETGIKVSDWYPHLWLRWGDALSEAGFSPNKMQRALSDDAVLEKYIGLVRELGRLPVHGELLLKSRNDSSFPSKMVFARFGGKKGLLAALLKYCETRSGFDDVAALCTLAKSSQIAKSDKEEIPKIATGFVYLMKSGRHYKIGRTNSVGRREWELGIKIPLPPKAVHYIETDDPIGIEAYWHRRFAEKRGEGEWFNLSAADIKAFKRWKRIA